MHAQSTIAFTIAALFAGPALGGNVLYGTETWEDRQLSDPCKCLEVGVVERSYYANRFKCSQSLWKSKEEGGMYCRGRRGK